MPLPYYVSPEQMMKDKAEYARKGIARGRSIVTLEYSDGILLVAENPSTLLHKVSEIYDRIAFAGVGKYNEFENLRIAGIRHADVKGFSYSRGDVSAKSLANAYSQALGNIFTQDIKPFEVEVLVAEVTDGNGGRNEIYHILYDGTIEDEKNYAAMGGQSDEIRRYLKENFKEGLDLGEAIQLGPAPDYVVAGARDTLVLGVGVGLGHSAGSFRRMGWQEGWIPRADVGGRGCC